MITAAGDLTGRPQGLDADEGIEPTLPETADDRVLVNVEIDQGPVPGAEQSEWHVVVSGYAR